MNGLRRFFLLLLAGFGLLTWAVPAAAGPNEDRTIQAAHEVLQQLQQLLPYLKKLAQAFAPPEPFFLRTLCPSGQKAHTTT